MSAARVLLPAPSPCAPLARVVDVERELKAALGPIAARARERSVELGCELVFGVGSAVLGDSRGLRRIATAANRALLDFQGSSGEIWVRVARRHAGFDATPDVLVSVTASDGQRSGPFDLSWPQLEEVEISPMPLSLMVVTPSVRSARVLEQAAIQAGVHATLASDGNDALEHVTGHDAVLVDDTLEGRGMWLIRRLHAKGITVLLATASRDPVERAGFLAAGASLIIEKPIIPADLAALGLEPPTRIARAGSVTMIP